MIFDTVICSFFQWKVIFFIRMYWNVCVTATRFPLFNITNDANYSIKKMIFRIVFPSYSHPRSKLDWINHNVYQFTCSKQCLHSKKLVKENLDVEFKENRYSIFFPDTHFRGLTLTSLIRTLWPVCLQ